MLVAAGILLIVVVGLALSPWWRQTVRIIGGVLGGLLAIYLVVRGVAEFWLIDVSRPETYQHDWGGPHLAGVLAVHTGPAVLITIAAGAYLRRWRRRDTTAPPVTDLDDMNIISHSDGQASR